MSGAFKVTAKWDPGAGAFTSHSDIPGLVVDAETFEEFVELVRALAPEVITANIPESRGPHKILVETRRELVVA